LGDKKMARSHVERMLQDVWDVCRVTADPDGDYPFRNGPAMGFVQLESKIPMMVRIWAIAATDVPRTAKLMYELNDVNVRSRNAWACWSNGSVTVEQALELKSLTRSSLREALDSVGKVANDIGGLVAAVYGGTTPFQPGDAEVAEGAA
jgi:hypothetical protein